MTKDKYGRKRCPCCGRLAPGALSGPKPWHKEAQRLLDEGYGVSDIAHKLELSRQAIYLALRVGHLTRETT